MLKILNNLAPFFEDCYRRISVREYAKLAKTSPPTASKLLKSHAREDLLNLQQERGFLFFSANRTSQIFVQLSRIYWQASLASLVQHLEQALTEPTIVLFGSLSKAEAKVDSDIDLAVFSPSKKSLNLSNFEKKIGRSISIFSHKKLSDVPFALRKNITNGFVLRGVL